MVVPLFRESAQSPGHSTESTYDIAHRRVTESETAVRGSLHTQPRCDEKVTTYNSTVFYTHYRTV